MEDAETGACCKLCDNCLLSLSQHCWGHCIWAIAQYLIAETEGNKQTCYLQHVPPQKDGRHVAQSSKHLPESTLFDNLHGMHNLHGMRFPYICKNGRDAAATCQEQPPA